MQQASNGHVAATGGAAAERWQPLAGFTAGAVQLGRLNKQQAAKNFDVVDVHGREIGTHPHKRKQPLPQRLASNLRKESACVSVAAVRAKIE